MQLGLFAQIPLFESSLQEVRSQIEASLCEERFSIKPLIDEFITTSLGQDAVRKIKDFKTIRGLFRFSFLIEAVNELVTSTKFNTRWNMNGPQHTTFEECCAIFEKLVAGYDPDFRSGCEISSEFSATAYEVPVDYSECKEKQHSLDNVRWVLTPEILAALKLRRYCLQDLGESVEALKAIIKSKIQIKAYLTDRTMTGEFKTNREKRWETNPFSYQYASRSNCLLIEKALTQQIFWFRSFPELIREKALSLGLIAELPEAHCPITLDVLDFNNLTLGVDNPVWGNSNFQVGHLNPLKSDSPDNRHTPGNVAWVSSEGNRLQGDLTLFEWRSLLNKIIRNHGQCGFDLTDIKMEEGTGPDPDS